MNLTAATGASNHQYWPLLVSPDYREWRRRPSKQNGSLVGTRTDSWSLGGNSVWAKHGDIENKF
jgi:hypothetical protein